MSLPDISLWLAVMAIILLITSELICPATEYTMHMVIEKKRLRLAALVLGVGFMVTVIMRIFHLF